MLITITNSNSSHQEVNSSEVSLKSQCEFCVCTQKHPKHLLGGRAYVTFVFVRTCVYTNSYLSRICISKLLKRHRNHDYNDISSYKFSLVCNRSNRSSIINEDARRGMVRLFCAYFSPGTTFNPRIWFNPHYVISSPIWKREVSPSIYANWVNALWKVIKLETV